MPCQCHPFGPQVSLDSLRRHPPFARLTKPMLYMYGRVFVSLRQAANHLPYAGLLPKRQASLISSPARVTLDGPQRTCTMGWVLHARNSSGLKSSAVHAPLRVRFLPIQTKPGFLCLRSESCLHCIWVSLDFQTARSSCEGHVRAGVRLSDCHYRSHLHDHPDLHLSAVNTLRVLRHGQVSTDEILKLQSHTASPAYPTRHTRQGKSSIQPQPIDHQ